MLTNHSHDRLHEGYEALKRVEAKLKDGTYPLEEAPCFCGADNDKVIKTEDRDGLPHRVVLCQSCALVRANPRPTAEAYYKFYNDEYRDFIYRWLDGTQKNRAEELEAIRAKEYKEGQVVLTKITDEDIPLPNVVIDIGCYQGGLLDAFKDAGSQTYGIELNDEARESARQRGHVVFRSIDHLIECDVKADFIVMHDVVEHFLDLNDMKKVAKLLKPDGNLYIFTPGMFRTDPSHYFQLAHTWYFVASTFGWVMGRLGFEATYLDEEICAIYHYTGVALDVAPPVEWVEYITDEAEGKEERKLPPFRGVCKFTKKLLYDNMRANFATKVPDIYAISGTEKGPVIVLGGGPSVNGEFDTIKALYDKGVPIIAIARMYPWCLKHGMTPKYAVSLDCSEEQEKGFTEICKETIHLASSVTRPEITKMVLDAGAPLYLFDSRDDRKIKSLRRDAGYEVATVINSGGTVTILSMSVAFNLGFRDIHLFGQDCMFPNANLPTHAEGIAGVSVEQRMLEVTVDGKDILTTPSFIEFAKQTLDLILAARDAGMLDSVKVYGESLINYMWDGEFVEKERAA